MRLPVRLSVCSDCCAGYGPASCVAAVVELIFRVSATYVMMSLIEDLVSKKK